ncbi:MAG: DUF4279 domain-containing protein [Planctomycetes bacterium]|jgi:hypothetical protein|nr:DUF4279 domain-containing protein [Planctomycetota bacterium]
MATRIQRYSGKDTEWSFVHLTLGGRDLDPRKINKALGLVPDHCGKRGELAATSTQRRCKAGSWSLESSQRNWRIETQMKSILKRITPVRQRLRRLIRDDATIERAYLTIAFEPPEGWPAVGYSLPAGLIGEFASLGLDIVLSIYFYRHVAPPGTSAGNGAGITRRKGDRNKRRFLR